MAATGPDLVGKPLTITERARRAQFVQVTIDLVAEHGYPGASLARIAEAAGVSKAAVLYHFPTKDAVVRAAYQTVIGALTTAVGAAVADHSSAAALYAYVRTLVGHLAARTDHARMIIEAITAGAGITDSPDDRGRRAAVAGLIDAAKAAGDYRADVDSRSTAVIVNGAIDAIVAQRLADSGFDAVGAADTLVDLLDRSLR
ncbi:TetR/AcrR family transcriptional regulator [Solwaraspora sp. WMMD406]|uniref:TetR/AcrR family transcriptional regulator n=1 Tax=Solwaraspora sp. WMMD406 TaxID=3016095 RepID=UPI0024169B0C|nr:TetR/AcrR family transcriptional regulator [Solwaraspora sp. WMMD406]MDG4764653.1 TetR/AcrR family transcriptional regulator [Solwaraspora sp. WMMD406]